MPDIPEAAIQAAAEVRMRQYESEYDASHLTWRDFADDAREILEAAAPLLAGELLRPLLKRHPRIEGEWGPSCGSCWIRGGSRAAWPCAELLAMSVLLPIPDDEVPDAP